MVVCPTGESVGEFVRHRAGAGRQCALESEHHGWRDGANANRCVEQDNEVDCVLGDDDPVLGSCAIEHLVVGTACEADIADVPRVMSEIGQVPGDRRAEHLVDEKPHEARKRSRSWAALSARRAAASLRRIIASTSSGWAAANDTAVRTNCSGTSSCSAAAPTRASPRLRVCRSATTTSHTSGGDLGRRLGGQAGFVQGVLLGDVGADPDHAGDRAVLVGQDPTGPADPPHLAVGQDHPVLDVVVAPGPEGLLDGRNGGSHVILVQQRQVGREGSLEPVGGDAEHLHQLLVPVEPVLGRVPVPGAHPAGLERQLVAMGVDLVVADAGDWVGRQLHRRAPSASW